ncbi:MAG: PD-(D/E)XK nuclease family protein [Nanoarchaeota archaeon]
METPTKIIFSASKLKTLQACSFLYYSKYIIGLPDKPNLGALIGTLIHLIFEVLSHPRHRKHYDEIIKKYKYSKSIKRFIKKAAKRLNIPLKENQDLINKMILTGLQYDFFLENYKNVETEKRIEIEGRNWKLNGFIDKLGVRNDDNNTCLIRDFKSSKKIDVNEIQALCYSLGMKKLKNMTSIVEFLFLQFPNNLSHKLQFTDEQLNGFELFLEDIAEKLQDFDEKKACSDFAANDIKKRWLCGKREPTKNGTIFMCQYREPFDYFALIDENGKVLKTDFEKKNLKCNVNQFIVKHRFSGCPAWNNQNNIIL